MYYDRQGNLISLDKYCKLSQDFNGYKRLARTELTNGKVVSTVWLGLDHGFEDGAPLIFETMVFPPDSYSELDCARYTNEQAAFEGHKIMVEKWEDGNGHQNL